MEDPFLLHRSNAAELFLVRHADAIPDVDEIIPGGIYDDLPLSRIGREQAQALAERLGSGPFRFSAIYSSPLKRCLETAAPLAKRLGMTPAIVPDLKEIVLGNVLPTPEESSDLEALTRTLRERQSEIIRIAGSTGSWDSLEGSESSKKFRHRVVQALDEIANHHIGERVLAFVHAGVVNAYIAEVLGMEKDFFFPTANTSISVVRVSGKQRVLYVLNDLAHVRRHT